MIVYKFQWPGGALSYQVVEATDAELAELFAAPDATSWIATNATVVSTTTLP